MHGPSSQKWHQTNPAPSLDDVRELVCQADPSLAVAIVLAADAGARVSDLITLQWRDFDLENGFVRLPGQFEPRNSRLSDWALEIVLKWKEHTHKRDPGNYVLHTKSGTRLSAQTLVLRFQEFVHRLNGQSGGGPHTLRFHDLRRLLLSPSSKDQ